MLSCTRQVHTWERKGIRTRPGQKGGWIEVEIQRRGPVNIHYASIDNAWTANRKRALAPFKSLAR